MTDEERKQRHREACRAYRLRHPEKCRAYVRAYRAAHKQPPPPVPTTKRCTSCLRDQRKEAFDLDRRTTGKRPPRGGLGVESICKSCKSHMRKPTLQAEREQRVRLTVAGLKRCNICRLTKPRSHFSVRRASTDGRSYTCRPCANAIRTQWRLDNPGAHAEWYRENIEHKRRYFSEWRAANLDRRAATYKKWAKENPAKINALIAKRTAAKLNATPDWADLDSIEEVYKEAYRLSKDTGVSHEVDHIVPLQSPHVCGLHVSWNLQVLTKTANLRKGNKFTPHTAPPQ